MTQNAIADTVGVSAAYVSQVLKGCQEEKRKTEAEGDASPEAAAVVQTEPDGEKVPTGGSGDRQTEDDVYCAGYARGKTEVLTGIRKEAARRGADVLRNLLLHTLDILRAGGMIGPEADEDWQRMQAFMMIADALGFESGERYLEEALFAAMGGERA